MGKKSGHTGKKKKLVITFDENARKNYLTGFHKRREERKAKARHELDEKLKQKVKEERKKRRKVAKEKVKTLLEGIDLFKAEDENEDQNGDAKVDFGSHLVTVKSGLDFSETGLFLTPNQNESIAGKTSKQERLGKVNKKQNTISKSSAGKTQTSKKKSKKRFGS